MAKPVPKILVGPVDKKPPTRIHLEDLLHHAIENGDAEMVKKLVGRGANLHEKVGGVSAYERAVWKHGEGGEITQLVSKRKI
jgi:hypothetical protein